jgi:hypothetical protein
MRNLLVVTSARKDVGWVSIFILFPLFIGGSSGSLDDESIHGAAFAKLVALLPASTRISIIWVNYPSIL